MLKPFVAVLAWASVLVIVFYPVHKRLSRVIKWPGLCAAVSSLLVIAAILIPFSIIASAVIRELSGMADYLQTNLPDLLGPNSSVIGRALRWLESHAGLSEVRLRQILADTLKATSGSLASQTLGLVGGAIGAILQGFFVIATMYYLFRDGDQILDGVRRFVPLEDSQSEAIFARAREVISASVYGVITIATIQGTLGGLAFWFLGLPSALLWGVLMTLLSMIPITGSWLVWIPAVVYLAATGHWVKAILLAVWGALVVSTVDNFLRPRLVGQRAHLHELLVLFSVIGGLKLFGFLGIVLGPVILAIAIALLTATKATEHAQRADQSGWTK
jgi:predicted PurR-regulated permease PerM